MPQEARPQTYDETIRTLEKKDHRGIAEFILPAVKAAENVTPGHIKMSIPDMREVDYLAHVKLGEESFILHIEFETAYRSNTEMHKRMLRYYTYIKWHNDLPIYQVLVLLKEPTTVRHVEKGYKSTVQGRDIMDYWYEVVKVYEVDKYEVLAGKQVVLYPLRIFMKHEGETEDEHILECLFVTEGLQDKDYYFLTLQCIKKLYEKGRYERFVKEEILMQSSLYKEPYEKGLEVGLEKGVEKGRREEKIDTIIRFLTKRFGKLPVEVKDRFLELDIITLDVILDQVWDYENLEEVKRYLQ